MTLERLQALGFNNLEEFKRWYRTKYRPKPEIEPPPTGWETGEGLPEPFRSAFLAEAERIDRGEWEPPKMLAELFGAELLERLPARAKKAIAYGWVKFESEKYHHTGQGGE